MLVPTTVVLSVLDKVVELSVDDDFEVDVEMVSFNNLASRVVLLSLKLSVVLSVVFLMLSVVMFDLLGFSRLIGAIVLFGK